MKNPCLPTQVTQILQRIAEFVSYLTVSNHYLTIPKVGANIPQREGEGCSDPSRGHLTGIRPCSLLDSTGQYTTAENLYTPALESSAHHSRLLLERDVPANKSSEFLAF